MILNSNEILREYFDYSDSDTVRTIAEAADDNLLLSALTSKLYDKIVEKADKIDFSTIARSRGDITKIENYASLVECIDIIRNIIVQYKEDQYPVDVVSSAMENIRSRTDIFRKAFTVNAPLPTLLYNTVVAAIVSSISFLIATCIEYVKTPQSDSIQVALDTVAYHKTFENLLFENLKKFNDGCASGEMDDTLRVCMERSKIRKESMVEDDEEQVEIQHDAPFLSDDEIKKDTIVHDKCKNVKINEGLISSATHVVSRVFLFIAKFLIRLIRDLVYFFFSSKQKISDYYIVQAELLEMNAYQLQYNNTVDVEKRKQIFDKQMKIVAKWRNKANKYNVDYTTSKKAAANLSNQEAKQYTVGELDNYNPNANDAFSGSALF